MLFPHMKCHFLLQYICLLFSSVEYPSFMAFFLIQIHSVESVVFDIRLKIFFDSVFFSFLFKILCCFVTDELTNALIRNTVFTCLFIYTLNESQALVLFSLYSTLSDIYLISLTKFNC